MDCGPFSGRTPGAGPGRRAHLHTLHQQQRLRVVLVGLQDEVSQLVDDDVQGALVLQRLAEVELEREGSGQTSREAKIQIQNG